MSRTASRIGGVDFDAQAAAREAARREGKTLGQWLHGAIAERAADLGVQESDLAGRERIEAVTARLDRLGGRAAAPSPRRSTQAGRGDGSRPRFHDGREPSARDFPARDFSARDSLARDSSRDAFPDERRSPRRAAGDDEGMFDGSSREHFAEGREPGRGRADEPAADALLADAVAAMERRHARTERRTDEALASFAELMERGEARRAQERDAVHALTRQMAAMESTLTERISSNDSPIKGALARLEARLDLIGKRSAAESAAREQAVPVEDEPLRRLESKINSLLQVVHGAQGRPAAVPGSAQADVAAEASPLAIRAAQSAQAAQSAREAPPAEPPRRRLGDAIAEISRRQHSLEQQDPTEPRASRGATAAALVETQAGAAGRRASDREAPDGEERTGLSPRGGGRPAGGAPPEPARIEQARLREEISAITARMGALPSAEQLAERAAARARIAAGQELAGRELAERERIEKERGEAERIAARAEADRAMQQLESERLAARAEAERAAARLEAERAARLEAERSARAEAERLARLAAERPDGPDPATAASLRTIEQRLDAIAGRVGEVLERPAVEPQLGSLERMVRDLAARLDAAGSRHAEGQAAEGQALEQLQSQVEAMVGRFERSENDLAVLPTLAASVRQLFDQLETVRASVETAAAETARETAREVLRIAAADHGRESGRTAAAESSRAPTEPDAMVAVQSMLGGVHEVLDRLVGRLTAVESNLAEVRGKAGAALPGAALSGTPAPPVAAEAVALRPSPSAPSIAPAAPTLGPAGPVFRPATQRPAAPRMGDIDAVRDPIAPPAAGRRIEVPAARFAAEADEDAQRLNFIAAARRAAKSAQLEAAQLEAVQAAAAKGETVKGETARGEGALPRRSAVDSRTAGEAEVRAGLMTKSREYVAAHKRPMLMGLAAILVVVGTLALLQRTGLGGSDTVALAPQPAKIARSAPAAEPPASRLVAADEPAPGATSRTAPPASARLAGGDLAEPLPSAAPSPAGPAAKLASTGASDPTPTGSITSLPAFAAQSPTVPSPAAQNPLAQNPLAMVRPPAVPGMPAGLQAAAEGGNAAAQYDLGARYADGRGVARDHRLASVWLGKSAEQNLAPAQYRLAMMYEKGIGVAQDKARARALYAAAAEAGNPRAMHNLAVMLADGDGHPDYAGAVGWFRKAAGYGIHDSQYNLAILLARGLGTAQSLVQSYQWFAVAASANDADAAHKRDEVGSKLNANDLALAKSLAAAYQPKIADPAALEASFPAGDGAPAATRLNSVKSKVSSL